MKPIQQKDIDSMLLLPSYFESEIYNEKEKQVIHHFLLANQLNQGTSYWSQKRLKWNKKQKKRLYYFPIQGKWLYIQGAYYHFVQHDFKISVCDLKISTLLKPLKIERTYQKSRTQVGWFGVGWITEFESFCIIHDHQLEIFFSDGSRELFQKKDTVWENHNPHSFAKVVHMHAQKREIIVQKKDIIYTFYWDGRLKRIENLNKQFFQLFYQDETKFVSHIQTSCQKKVSFFFSDGKVERITDFYGRTVHYVYESDYLVKVIQINGGQYQYRYSDHTQTLIQIINPLNQFDFQIRLTYEGKISEVFLDSENKWKVQYKPREFCFQLTNDATKDQLSYIYTQKGYIHNIYLNQDVLYHIVYDDLGNMIQLTNQRNRILDLQYNMKNQCIYKKWEGHWRRYHYESYGKYCKIQNDQGFECVFFYDERQNLIQKRQLVAQGMITTCDYIYDMKGRLSKFVDENKHPIQYEYEKDTQVFPSKIIFPNQYVIHNTYDVLERKVLKKDQNGIAIFKYNMMDFVVKTIYENDLEDFIRYDSVGNIIEIISPEEWKQAKENQMRPRCFGITYDFSGKIDTVVDPDGQVFIIEGIEQNQGKKEEKSYTRFNFVRKPLETWTAYIQADKKEYYQFCQYKYDKKMNCTQCCTGEQWVQKKEKPTTYQTVNYKYDDRDNLTQICSSNGMNIRYFYQGQSKCIKMKQKITDEQDYIVIYQYNESGLLHKKMERMHKNDLQDSVCETLSNDTIYVYIETIFSYDGDGHLTAILFPNGERVQISYHANGEILSPHYLKGMERTVYEEQKWIYKEDRKIKPQSSEYQFVYNQNGQMIQTILKSDPSFVRQYFYNALGNVEEISDENGKITKIIYGPNHRMAQIFFPNQTSIRLSYDAAGNITEYINQNGEHYIYEYNSINKIKTIILNGKVIERFTYALNGECIVQSFQ